VDERDDEALLVLSDINLNGYIENEYFAIVFSLEYEVQLITSGDTEKVIMDSRPTHRIALGSGILVPSDGKDSLWKAEGDECDFRLSLCKLDSTLELGLNTVCADDFMTNTRSNEQKADSEAFLSLTGTVSKVSVSARRTSDDSIMSPGQMERSRKEYSSLRMDELSPKYSDVILDQNDRREQSEDAHVDDDMSESSSIQLDSSLYIDRPLTQSVIENRRDDQITQGGHLLAESLGLKVNRHGQGHRTVSSEVIETKSQEQNVNYFSSKPTVKPLSRAMKSRLDRHGFMDVTSPPIDSKVSQIPHDLAVDFREELLDPLTISDISVQFAGIRFQSPEIASDIRCVFCSFQFYNCKPTTSETYRLSFSSTEDRSAVFLREEVFSRDEPPLALRFLVDRSKSKLESAKFVAYLCNSFMTVDVWNADSLMLIGSIHVRITCGCNDKIIYIHFMFLFRFL